MKYLLTDPALHSCTWWGFYDIWRVDTYVQAQNKRYADGLHLKQNKIAQS